MQELESTYIGALFLLCLSFNRCWWRLSKTVVTSITCWRCSQKSTSWWWTCSKSTKKPTNQTCCRLFNYHIWLTHWGIKCALVRSHLQLFLSTMPESLRDRPVRCKVLQNIYMVFSPILYKICSYPNYFSVLSRTLKVVNFDNVNWISIYIPEVITSYDVIALFWTS